jgi:hypothetical protein
LEYVKQMEVTRNEYILIRKFHVKRTSYEHTEFVECLYLHTKFHISGSGGPLIIAVKLKTNENVSFENTLVNGTQECGFPSYYSEEWIVRRDPCIYSYVVRNVATLCMQNGIYSDLNGEVAK